MKHHILKCDSEYFDAIELGLKKFELRINDRNFQVGDLLFLDEMKYGKKTGKQIGPLEIKYILEGGKFGLSDEYCIMNW